jgi:DNA (cytosine-5)-methyltransferase 1
MVKYSCERCGKEFSQKSHYDSHNRRKTPCENNADKIKALVDKAVEEKLKELNNKKMIVENEEVIVNTDTMEQQPKKNKIKKKKFIIVDNKLKFIDLCSGIGGFHFGLKKHKCILACDINKWCRESYETNFNIKCKEDIFELNVDELCDFDILCAGFPCQPFSSAGLKKGMKDDRSKVYDKIINIVLEKQPRIVLLENVKNLLVMNKGEVIKKIVSDLEKLNYNVSYSLLNTANFGLAQNRERVYIVCTNKNKYDISFNFNNLESMNIRKNLKDIIDFNNKEYIEEDKYILLENDKIKTQTSGLIFCGYLKGNLRTNGALPNTEHLSRVHKQPNRIYHINGVNPTLSSSEGSGRYYIYDGIGVRRLSFKECFKIMGFPDDYIFHNKTNVNYCQIGNAVSPVIINNIYNELCSQNFIQDPLV